VMPGAVCCAGVTNDVSIFQNVDSIIVAEKFKRVENIQPPILQAWRTKQCTLLFQNICKTNIREQLGPVRCTHCASSAHNLKRWVNENAKNSLDQCFAKFSDQHGGVITKSLLIQVLNGDENSISILKDHTRSLRQRGQLPHFLKSKLEIPTCQTEQVADSVKIETVYITFCQQFDLNNVLLKYSLDRQTLQSKCILHNIVAESNTLRHNLCNEFILKLSAKRDPKFTLCRNCSILRGKLDFICATATPSTSTLVNSRCATKWLSHETMMKKLNVLSGMMKSTTQREKRLREKISRNLAPKCVAADGKVVKVFEGIFTAASQTQNTSEILKEIIVESIPAHKRDSVPVEEIKILSTHLANEIRNQAMKFSGSEKRVCYNSVTLHTALAVFRKGKGEYKEFCALSPFLYPSPSLLQKYVSTSRVNSGIQLQLYTRIHTYLANNKLTHLDAILLFDEVKISGGITWNATTHEIQGFCENELDYATLLSKKNTKNENETENQLAVYLNQWKIVSESSSFSCPVEFFSTNVPVKSDALLVQLFHVLLFLEEIHVHVHAICCDAGTANSKVFRLLRNQTLPDFLTFNIDEECTFFPSFCRVEKESISISLYGPWA
jgi:hypothetical protein